MECLNAKDYKTLMIALYKAQIHNLPPPEFKGMAKVIASMIFPCIERRKAQSKKGLAGASARLAKQGISTVDIDTPASSCASSCADNQSKEKKNKTKYTYNKAGQLKADATAAKEGSSFDLEDFFEAAVRRSLGDASE